MKKQLCVAAAACLLPVAASAADLPARPAYRAPVMAPAPIATWTACYVGGHAGYGWSRWRDRDLPGAETLVGIPGTPSDAPGDQVVFGYSGRYSTSGFVGGGQFGCDRQFGNFVLGAVVDFSWADQKKDSALFDIIPGGSLSNDEQATVRMRYFGTARARAGFLAMPTVLLYGTGGFAWARTEMTVRGQAFTGPGGFDQFDAGTYPFSVSGKANHIGWTAGVGADWMFAPGWTLGLEYLHLDLGNAHYRFGDLGTLPNRTTREILGRGTNVSLTSDVVRATLNYRF